jgi:hypothetical protein
VVRGDIFAFILILGEKVLVSTIISDVSCRIFVNVLYQVEEVSLYS